MRPTMSLGGGQVPLNTIIIRRVATGSQGSSSDAGRVPKSGISPGSATPDWETTPTGEISPGAKHLRAASTLTALGCCG
ncbi:hypothetical protein PG984_002724 [Apiospora sp. TS-2023a]